MDMRRATGLAMDGLEDIAELGRDTGAYHRLVNPFERPALGHGPASTQSE